MTIAIANRGGGHELAARVRFPALFAAADDAAEAELVRREMGMSGADRLEDGFPHGTAAGYLQGCKGGDCPMGEEVGLSCRRAKQLAAGDYRYQKLIRRGATPGEIADELGLMPEVTAAPAKRRAAVPYEEEDVPVADQDEEIEGEDPIMNTDNAPATPGKRGFEQFKPVTTEKFTAGLKGTAKTARLHQIREWCRQNGYPGVPTHGRIPLDALQAYDAAHHAKPTEPDEPLSEAHGAGQPVIIPEEVAEVVEAVIDEELAALNREADGESELPERETMHVVVHGPVADAETRAELFNEGWDEAERQLDSAAVLSLTDALQFALEQWARAVDRAERAEAALAERPTSSPRWWSRSGR